MISDEDTVVGLSRMTAAVAELEGQPLPRIVAAARCEARLINLTLPEATLHAWARAVHCRVGFRFQLR